MTISRRKFTQTVGIALAAAPFSGALSQAFAQSLRSGDLFQVAAGAYGERLMSLNSIAFQPFIGTIFRSKMNENESSSLRLTEVRLSPQVKGSLGNGESFSLLFRGIGRQTAGEGVHTFDHPALGTFSLFIAPVERGRVNFEAVVNHIIVQ